MASVSSMGVGSGLDIQSLITQLMDVERKPISMLESKQTGIQAKISAFGSIQSALATFADAAKALGDSDKLTPMKTSSSSPELFGASASATAAAGSYDVEVKQLAQAQKLASGGFSSTTSPVGDMGSSLTFDFGSYAGGSFNADAARPARTITLDASNNSLNGLRDAINQADMGVRASIINDGTNYRLTLTSTETGEASALRITASDASVDAFSFDKSGGPSSLTEAVVAQNAKLEIDGIEITSTTNVVEGAIEGVTLGLDKAEAGKVSRLSIGKDNASVQSAIEGLVSTFNALNKVMQATTGYNNNKSSILTTNSTARDIGTQMRSILGHSISGLSGTASNLQDVGISFEADGSLKLDANALRKALDNPDVDIAGLFAGKGGSKGYASQITSYVDQLTGSRGLLTLETNSLDRNSTQIRTNINELNAKLVTTEASYRKMFGALDVAIGSMRRTSDYLTQQFAAMADMNKANSK